MWSRVETRRVRNRSRRNCKSDNVRNDHCKSSGGNTETNPLHGGVHNAKPFRLISFITQRKRMDCSLSLQLFSFWLKTMHSHATVKLRTLYTNYMMNALNDKNNRAKTRCTKYKYTQCVLWMHLKTDITFLSRKSCWFRFPILTWSNKKQSWKLYY